MSRRKPKVGDVIQIKLPSDCYAYGRVLRDASVAFYSETTTEPGLPPIGSRSYEFVVGVYEDVLKSDEVPVVGYDPSQGPDDEWPPPYCVRDPISGGTKIYYRGAMTPASAQECEHLEPAAVWDLPHLVDRLMGVRQSPS